MYPVIVVMLLAVIEGLTEFLPVSSTAHMIILEKIIGNNLFSKKFLTDFLVIIQIGPIFAAVFYFWDNLNPFVKSKKEFQIKIQLLTKILVGLIPAIVLGFLLDDLISEYLMDNLFIIAATLIIYGVIFIVVENMNRNNELVRIKNMKQLPYKFCFFIGLAQCLAMIPGTSRSGSTIIASLLLGLSRGVAAEYSFYLAIPTMLGATALKLIKSGFSYSPQEWIFLGIGTIVGFLVGYAVISWFMNYIRKRSFAIFGTYRILLAITIIVVSLIYR